jgi:hypothetical protein
VLDPELFEKMGAPENEEPDDAQIVAEDNERIIAVDNDRVKN